MWRLGATLDLTLSFIIELEEPKYKYTASESTRRLLTKSTGNNSRVSKHPALPPLDQGGPETPGHEDFAHLFTQSTNTQDVPATG